jgi:hypothetical protein
MLNRGPVETVFVLILGIVLPAVPLAVAKDATPNGHFNVRSFGAMGDGTTKDTAAVQRAIDSAAKSGGTVYFAPGTYLCGSLHLRSNVNVNLDSGATILGSKDNADYDPIESLGFKNDADSETSFFNYALIWGEGVEHIAITGMGTIDSNYIRRKGPKTIALKRCNDVQIRGIRTLNSPNYAISLLGTDNVVIDSVTILNAFADGIDPDACRNVRISNCHIESHDDAIVPKTSFSLGEHRASENITVTNCYLATIAQCFKLGTESGGDFKRIAVSNCVMAGLAPEAPAVGGIALESVDGAHIDGVVVSNITMVNVRAPIFLRLGNRGRDMATPVPGSFRHVSISSVVATNATLTSSITGIPGHPIEGVTLSDVRIMYRAGEIFTANLGEVAEQIAVYPAPRMFGPLPAYGLYVRHADDITLRNVHLSYEDDYCRITTTDRSQISWSKEAVPAPSAPGNAGPALVCDDVSKLTIESFASRASEGHPVVRFANVREAMLLGSRAPEKTGAFVEVSGAMSRNISLIGNSFQGATKPIVIHPEVKRKTVQLTANTK